MAPQIELSSLGSGKPAYEVGTRLLVSGESRWGEEILRDGLAWGCGFTRHHDADMASLWADATS